MNNHQSAEDRRCFHHNICSRKACLVVCLPECRREVDRHVLVSLLEALVLSDEMQVIAPNNDGALHLHLDDGSSKNASTDGHIAGERTLLVDVGAFNCL